MERRQEDVELVRAARMSRFRRAVTVLVLALVVGLGGLGIASSQSAAKKGITERWSARADQSADFVETYADQLFSREELVARKDLAGPAPSIETVALAFGFSNALLLDDKGRVLSVYPEDPALVGRAIASEYPHLTAAEAGRRAVSPVVPAAADGAPVVGFALPFMTLDGRRVFSGAYAVGHTPLTAYLERMTPLKGAAVYLVDDRGNVVTSSTRVTEGRSLRAVDPSLAKAMAGSSSGYFDDADTQQYFAKHRVGGTPWTLVARAPTQSLFYAVNGRGHALPWVLLGILALVLGVAVTLWFRRIDDHADLRVAYGRLDRLASLDGLTGVLNRRATRTELELLHARSQERRNHLSVLMVDVDHFKPINDTFGHAAGDVALCAVADRLRSVLRDHDVLGRWGGEEFLAVLPDTDRAAAQAVAERLRSAVAAAPVEVGTGGDAISVSVSIGVSSSATAGPDVLVHVADRALYVAKDAGRDRVHASSV